MMDALFAEVMASLHGGEQAINQELHPLLHAENPDWSMLMRVREVASEYAVRARQLRQMMSVGGVDAGALEEVNRLCEYFDGMADVIARETEDAG